MKTFLSVAFAGLFLAFTASADPVFGVWKTQPGNEGNYAYVEIKECDGKICGGNESKLLTLLIKKLPPKILAGIL